VYVTQAASPALGYQEPLPRFQEFAERLIGLFVFDAGANRDPDGQVMTAATGPFPSHAVLTSLRLMGALMAKIYEGVQAAVRQ
jgi:hypothetical protein